LIFAFNRVSLFLGRVSPPLSDIRHTGLEPVSSKPKRHFPKGKGDRFILNMNNVNDD